MSVISPGPARTALQLGVCFAVAAALVYVVTRDPAEPEPWTEAAAPAAGVPAPPASEAAPAVEAVTETPAPGAPPPAAAAMAPSVDVVRVAPDGAAVVAGRAEPGASVTVYAEDQKLAEAKADAGGNFVAIFRAEPSAEPRALTLGSETPEGKTAVSDQVVLLLPETPAPAAEATPPVAPATTEAPAPEAGAAAARPEPRVATTAILSPKSVEVTPMARPTGAAAKRVSLASISYADAGEVTLAGFGLAGAQLRAYVDDAFARDGTVDANGRWTLALGDVAAGVYRLRIDQIGADGKVSSRVETPFQRDYPMPRPTPGDDASKVAVVVQPGNNLWTLARIHYGSGVLYTQIFTANSDLIGDPDLIYPGQIFRLPEKQAQQ